MKNMFQAGELAKLQKISKQTLLFYDKIGLFCPRYIDPSNGYRYYGAEQIDYLDAILIMKKAGFTLDEIKQHMKDSSAKSSLKFLEKQIDVIDDKIKEWTLLKSRLTHRCTELEEAMQQMGQEPELQVTEETCLLYYEVESPYQMSDISVATKKCYAQALTEDLPVFFQCGVSVPFKQIQEEHYTQADLAFVTSEYQEGVSNLKILPKGLTVNFYHLGNYNEISRSYKKILNFCSKRGLKIISDSYEFCINDYITSKNEEEFITKIMFYVEIGKNS